MVLSGRKLGQRITEAADDTFLAESDHGIEERRRNGLADNGNADRVDQKTCLYTASFGNCARSVIAGVVIPFRKRGQRIGGFCEEIRNFRIFPEFILGG